jgi:ornithine lipid ester-linked acyl 2-hydroxylase
VTSVQAAAAQPGGEFKSALPKRPWPYRAAKKARFRLDRLIARSSLIPNDPLLDAALFPWTEMLRDNWQAIRAEAAALLPRMDRVPPLRSVSPDHQRIARSDLWKSFFLCGYGYWVEENVARCPETAALVRQIPGLNSAFFSILLPGMHIKSHRGPTKGLVTCHLGLMVPESDSVRMQVGDRLVRWREGECLVFDDTYRHEVWHEGDSPRIVLLIQVRRPLRAPGRQIAALFLGAIRRSPFVQEGRRKQAAWDAAIKAADRPVD